MTVTMMRLVPDGMQAMLAAAGDAAVARAVG
jgi:hypothetical protein